MEKWEEPSVHLFKFGFLSPIAMISLKLDFLLRLWVKRKEGSGVVTGSMLGFFDEDGFFEFCSVLSILNITRIPTQFIPLMPFVINILMPTSFCVRDFDTCTPPPQFFEHCYSGIMKNFLPLLMIYSFLRSCL